MSKIVRTKNLIVKPIATTKKTAPIIDTNIVSTIRPIDTIDTNIIPTIRPIDTIDKFTLTPSNKISNRTCFYCKNTNSSYYFYNGKMILCRFCFVVTSLNYGYCQEIEIYYSKIPQIDIINATRNYYVKNYKMPKPIDIDPNIKNPDITILELVYILKSNTKINMSGYKIFFTDKFKIDVDVNVKLYDSSVFDDDDDADADTDADAETDADADNNIILAFTNNKMSIRSEINKKPKVTARTNNYKIYQVHFKNE